MFTYKEWDKICQNIRDYKGKCLRIEDIVGKKNRTNNICIKHDVETNPSRALKMAVIEHKYGIKATYYIQEYLINDKNAQIFRKIKEMGHEIAYHYDVLDSENGNINKADEKFQAAIKKFKKYGFIIKTICPHGNPYKKRDGWNSNKDFMKNQYIKSKYKDMYDVVVDLAKEYKGEYIYISDAGYGWKIITEISENDKIKSIDISINMEHYLNEHNNKLLIISSHPHRWRKYYISSQTKKIIFMIAKWMTIKLKRIRYFDKMFTKYYYLAKKI